MIAWKCLSLAIQRRDRQVVLVKLLHGLLATASRMHRFKQQTHAQCHLCKQEEDIDHILRCSAPPRQKWRQKLCNNIFKTLKKFSIPYEAGAVFCDAITEWFETGEVTITKHPEKYHQALQAQQLIGWRQIFMGRIACQWLDLHPSYFANNKYHENYIWGASLVETILRGVLDLWKARNDEVYGKADDKDDTRQRELLTHRIKQIQQKRDSVRPGDHFLFITDTEEFCKKATVAQMTTYISSTKDAIKNSIKQVKNFSIEGVTSILQYIKPKDKDGIPKLMQRLRDKFQKEEIEKENKRKVRKQNKRNANKQGADKSNQKKIPFPPI